MYTLTLYRGRWGRNGVEATKKKKKKKGRKENEEEVSAGEEEGEKRKVGERV